MVGWKSRAAAAQICRTTTPVKATYITFFLHSDALFGVQQVVLTTSTSLNMQSCCHASGWLGISFNEQHNSCSQWRSSLWCDHPRVPVSMALVSKVTLSSSLVLQRQKVDFLCFIKHWFVLCLNAWFRRENINYAFRQNQRSSGRSSHIYGSLFPPLKNKIK